MIKVAFILQPSQNWMGGFNYYKNLFKALNILENKLIEPILFLGEKSDPQFFDAVKDIIRIEKVGFLNRWSLQWLVWKLSQKFLPQDYLLKFFLRSYGINVISHSNIIRVPGIKTINWIPDFQHMHLPEMFSDGEIRARDSLYFKLAKYSDGIILSSDSAKSDFVKFANEYSSKARVLKFVGQPSYSQLTESDEIKILQKFNVSEEFFYLPNQFWKHKNHMVVLKALKILKEQGLNILLVCSGYKNDYRNKDNFMNLERFVIDNNLNVMFLGLIESDEVTVLMKRSIAVLNPSLFEGWSTTVEECKTLNKGMILSDIPVHREQNPSSSAYFKASSYTDLAKIIESLYTAAPMPRGGLAVESLIDRIRVFACSYEKIVTELGLQ